MCDRSWAHCPLRTEGLTLLCFAAVMCLPDAPDLTLLITCSSCQTKVLVCCKLYKSRCLVRLWWSCSPKTLHYKQNTWHFHCLFSLTVVQLAARQSQIEMVIRGNLAKKSDVPTWVWVSRAQEIPGRRRKNVTLFCHTQSPAKKKKKTFK